jgi:hypothetical protein
MSLLTEASLVITPNAVEEGKLFSIIPTDGSGDLTVVRATTATRVNSAGLIEVVPYNLLQRSEETADLLGVTANGRLLKSNTLITGVTYTFSIYTKKETSSLFSFDLYTNTTNQCVFNFDTETLSGTLINKSFEKLTDGWYRIIGTITLPTSSLSIFIYGQGGFNLTPANSYIWGAQLVKALQQKNTFLQLID